MLVETNEGVKTHSSHRLVPGKKKLILSIRVQCTRLLQSSLIGHQKSAWARDFRGFWRCYHCASHVVNKHLVTGVSNGLQSTPWSTEIPWSASFSCDRQTLSLPLLWVAAPQLVKDHMPTHSCEVTFWRSIPNASLASQGDCRFYRNIPQYKTSKSASKSCKETVAAIYLSSNNHKSNLALGLIVWYQSDGWL
jgi:hypothetical protein